MTTPVCAPRIKTKADKNGWQVRNCWNFYQQQNNLFNRRRTWKDFNGDRRVAFFQRVSLPSSGRAHDSPDLQSLVTHPSVESNFTISTFRAKFPHYWPLLNAGVNKIRCSSEHSGQQASVRLLCQCEMRGERGMYMYTSVFFLHKTVLNKHLYLEQG